MYDINESPVAWYLASYLIRFTEIGEPGNDDPEKRFEAWENTIILRAKSFEEAYRRITELAARETRPFKGGPDGIDVKWEYVGVTDLLPIYEELEDGSEIAYREHDGKSLKELRAMIKTKGDLLRAQPET